MFAKNIVVKMHVFLMIFCLALYQPTAYAIDPISGAWTANAAASAALGGGVSGGAAAVQAAVTSAAGAAATAATAAAAAAAIAGAGVAAFCLTSWAIGSNGCGNNPFGASTGIPAALSGAGISVDPASGNLVSSAPVYFTQSAYSGLQGHICFRNSPTAVSNCLQELSDAFYQNYATKTTIRSTSCDLTSPAAVAPKFVTCGSITVSRAPDSNPTSFQALPTVAPIYAQVSSVIAQDEDIGAAIAKNPRARAAAAAAVAQPNITAAEAAAAASAAPALTAEAECAAKGMKHGTFNGTVFCVGVGAGTDGTGADAGETGTDAGAGTGTGEGTSTGEGTGTGTGSTPLPAFCVYAQTLCEWILWTKQEPTLTPAPEVPKREISREELPTAQQINFGGGCPSAETFQAFGKTIRLPYDVACDLMRMIKPFVIVAGNVVALFIFINSIRN